jgi:RNA 2',3'-cyclic 3'-phosphodiesterase
MSRGAKARLFVAADIPLPVREQLASWARGAAVELESAGAPRPLRLLDPDVLHLTLCFLGSRPVEEIAVIGSTLSECAVGMGELSVGAPLWLGGTRPRSLAVAIHDDDGELVRLQAAVRDAISDTTGWEPERRRFRAHVTVARIRGRTGGRAGGRVGRHPPTSRTPIDDRFVPPATPQLRFTPESVTLYRSWLSPEGATYETVATCGLVPSEV